MRKLHGGKVIILGYKASSIYIFLSFEHSKEGQNIFWVFVFMCILSIISFLYVEPGRVPANSKSSEQKRLCSYCHTYKPDRCHHCLICRYCVLNLDHHSPLLNKCVGFYNRKAFILSMFYAVFYSFFPIFSLYSASSDLYLSMWENAHSLILVLISGVFIIFFAILTMFLLSHLTMVFKNVTTQELAENNKDRKYSIGTYMNFVQVFGKRPIMWLVPYSGIYAPLAGNGIDWRVDENFTKTSLDKKND